MKKKSQNSTTKVSVTSKAPVKEGRITGTSDFSADAQASYFELRDRRSGINGMGGGQLDEATQRLWDNCMYPQNLTFRHYYDMYARNNVASRVIETFPNYTWNVVPIVVDSGGEKSRFSKAANKLMKKSFKWKDGIKQDLLTTMKQLDVLGGIGGESLLVFGFTDGGKLDTPVNKLPTNKIAWIKILHNGQFENGEVCKDTGSPEYGDVINYRTKEFTSATEINFANHIEPNVTIHHTRCVHFKESNGLSYGTSRIQKCYNQLLDIVKVSGASAEVYWLGAFSGLTVSTHPDTRLSEEARTGMIEEVKKYFAGLTRALLLEGANAKLLYPSIVSPEAHFDLQISMVSIATEIPRRFLTGAEAAKLASQQDSINWMDRVSNRRDRFVGPKVVSPVIQRCIEAGVLPAPKDDELDVIWPKTQSQALEDRADGAQLMTRAISQYFEKGMSKVMTFKVYLMVVCGYGEEEAMLLSENTQVEKYKLPQPPVAKQPVEKKEDAKPTEDKKTVVKPAEKVVKPKTDK